jgi:hypothetical protein
VNRGRTTGYTLPPRHPPFPEIFEEAISGTKRAFQFVSCRFINVLPVSRIIIELIVIPDFRNINRIRIAPHIDGFFFPQGVLNMTKGANSAGASNQCRIRIENKTIWLNQRAGLTTLSIPDLDLEYLIGFEICLPRVVCQVNASHIPAQKHHTTGKGSFSSAHIKAHHN